MSTNEFKQIMEQLKLQNEKLDEHSKKLDEHSKKLDEHSKKLDENRKKLDKHDKKLDEHDDKVNGLTEVLNELLRITTNIEYQVTEKIPALFDAYNLTQDQHVETVNRMDNLENKLDNHSVRIAALEVESSKHSEAIANL